MMGEQQNEVRAVFLEALALTAPEERARYLDAACRDKPDLRQRVEALLSAREHAGEFLKRDALGGNLDCDPAITEGPGTVIGRYKLLEQIGEGGFGVVFMAEQVEPIRRRVALKIVKPGMDTKQVIARFEAERQALAMMDHPNIAKIFDAGVTGDPSLEPSSSGRESAPSLRKGNESRLTSAATLHLGRPYFVMELVHGVPLTQFCDANDLTPHDRLKLFLTVCEAVQHAHQKGVIHRDLKPSNILVTLYDGKPVPKVIDFGTAKALQQTLTEKTLFTAYGKLIGTPQYMSPEQAEMSGLDVDTRADIYSLGVLLYELLTGTTPFEMERLRAAAFEEMLRIIREEEPPKPSTRVSTLGVRATEIAGHRQVDPALLRRTIHGDLDWIVMKALEKDRARRYETANALAEDIECHLDHQPVRASPPRAVYRARKFIRRHRMGVAMAASVTAVLIAGLVVSLLAFAKARHERDRALLAEQRAAANEQKARSEAARSAQVAQFMKDMLLGVGPSVALGRDTTMLKEILEKTAERLGKELMNHPEVEAELRNSIGFVYWELGEHEKACSMYRQSLELMRKVWGNEHAAVADTLHNLAKLLRRAGDSGEGGAGEWAEAELMERQALAIREKLFGREHPAVGASLNNLGFMLQDAGKLAEGEAMLREALAINQKVLGDEHPQAGLSLSRLGTVLEAQGKLAEAETTLRRAVTIQRKALGKQPMVPAPPMALAPQVELGWTLSYLARVLVRQGRLAEAETFQREAVAMVRKVLGEGHIDLVALVRRLGDVLAAQGKLAEAEELYRESVAINRKLGKEDKVTVLLLNLAEVLTAQGKLAEAEATFREAFPVYLQQLERDSTNTATLYYRALLYLDSGDTHRYRAAAQQAVAQLEQATPRPNSHLLHWAVALGPDAVTNYAPVLEAVRRAVARQTNSAASVSDFQTLGALLYRARRYPEAAQQLAEADQFSQRFSSNAIMTSPAYGAYFLAMTHAQLGHTNEATACFHRASALDPLVKPAAAQATNIIAWNRRLTLQLLRREAESVLNTPAP